MLVLLITGVFDAPWLRACDHGLLMLYQHHVVNSIGLLTSFHCRWFCHTGSGYACTAGVPTPGALLASENGPYASSAETHARSVQQNAAMHWTCPLVLMPLGCSGIGA